MPAKKTKKRAKKRARKKKEEAPVGAPEPEAIDTAIEDGLRDAAMLLAADERSRAEEGLSVDIMLQRAEQCDAELRDLQESVETAEREDLQLEHRFSEFDQLVNAINAQGLITRRDAWRIAAHQEVRHVELLRALSNLGLSIGAIGQAIQSARSGA